MKKSFVTLINKEYANRQDLFLKDPKSDLFVIVHSKIFALHQDYLHQIGYFNPQNSKNQKVTMVDTIIDVQMYQIIGYFYGKQLKFTRDWSIEKLMHDIQFLNIPCLQSKLHNDIKNNFDQYGFFLLLSLAYKFQIKWLKQQCQEDLIMMGFQQLNYNRYDLFQVDKEVLQEIIRLHEILKINKDIVGLKDFDLRKILNQYSKINNVQLEISQMLSFCETSTSCTKVIEESDQQSQEIRKRTSTWDQNKKVQSHENHQDKSKSIYSCANEKIPQDQIIKQRQSDLKKLTNWNQTTNEKGYIFISQSKDIKNDIYNDFLNKKMQSKGQRFNQISQISQEQDKKFINLKTQMQKMIPMNKRSCTTSKKLQIWLDVNENPPKLSKSSQTNDSKLFSRMPQLQKEFDD